MDGKRWRGIRPLGVIQHALETAEEVVQLVGAGGGAEDVVVGGVREVLVVELADGSTYEIPGTLDMVGFEVNPATGTAQFRASIPNPDGKLIDGQFVKV